MLIINPKIRFIISRIIPFAVLFLLSGWLFLFTEIVATRDVESMGEEVIQPDLTILVFASLSIFIFGFFVGFLEIVVFKDLFKEQSLRRKLLSKLLLYTLFFFIIICLTYPIAAALEDGLSVFHPKVMARFQDFVFSITFFNAIFQLAVSLLISLVYSAISENIGQSVLINFFTGKYHRPKIENRIFMFLDMKSSTTIAEEIGHIEYFKFLSAYYEVFSDTIIQHKGEVYQYIGDEIVITWPLKIGLDKGNCIECFFAMKEALKKHETHFKDKFNTIPDFKAGLHFGEVTTGELGALKKEITFTGDVINTTSRIQSLCKSLKSDLVVSEDLLSLLNKHKNYPLQNRGKVELEGKSQTLNLFVLPGKNS